MRYRTAMSDTNEILVEQDGRVVTLTFNRPEARNAMTFDMYERLHDLCERFDKDPATEISTTVDVYRDIAERYGQGRGTAAAGAPSSSRSPLAEHPLPPAHILDRLMRYEVHLTRDLRLWQADLERWQARRLERELLAQATGETPAAGAAGESGESRKNGLSAEQHATPR